MTSKIEQLPPLREIIRHFGLDAKKSLGQNFLFDLNLTGRIARAAQPFNDCIIEIGPGPGGLTRALLLAGAPKIIAIEKDRRAINALAPLVDAAEGRLQIIEANALDVDISALKKDGERLQIVANLPYNIATVLLLNWLDKTDLIDSMTLMFQREVGARITAKNGGGEYGRLAVITQWLCEAQSLFDVAPSAFVPPPKVTSSVLRITPRTAPLAKAEKIYLEQVTRGLFGQRRKMLRSSIKTLGKTIDWSEYWEEWGLTGDERPETLPIEVFCAIAEVLRKITNDAR